MRKILLIWLLRLRSVTRSPTVSHPVFPLRAQTSLTYFLALFSYSLSKLHSVLFVNSLGALKIVKYIRSISEVRLDRGKITFCLFVFFSFSMVPGAFRNQTNSFKSHLFSCFWVSFSSMWTLSFVVLLSYHLVSYQPYCLTVVNKSFGPGVLQTTLIQA